MKRSLKMYGVAIRSAFASAMAYRADFFFGFFINLVSNMLTPLVTILIYGAGASIPGWSVYEALLIQSVFMLCTGLCSPLFYNMVWVTMGAVKSGTYDLLLIKPCSVMATTMAQSFSLDSIGVLLSGLTMFLICLSKLPAPSVWNWVCFAFLLLMGMMVLFGMIALMSASAFKWVGNGRIFEIFDSVSQFGRYPLTIFPKWLGIVVSYLFPVALIGFYPASAILGEVSPSLFWVAIPCVLFMLFGSFVFQRMVRAYQSAGG